MNVFRNSVLNKKLNKDGYIIIDLLSDDELNELLDIYNKYFPDKSSPFYISTFHSDFEIRKIISYLSQQTIAKHAEKLFVDFKFVASVFALKRGQNNVHFDLHQDISITDESLYPGISIWCPLQDVDETNGALYVVPRSHFLPTIPRGMNLPGVIDDVKEHIVTNYAIPVQLKKGQAIVWHHSLMHGSYPNTSKRDRVASVSLLIPREAPVLMYYASEPEKRNIYPTQVLKMDDGAYDLFDVRTKPKTGTSLLRTENIKVEKFSKEQISSLAVELGFPTK